MPDPRPTLVYYSQHALGLGHLRRAFALVDALAPHFKVVFLSGGRLPAGLQAPLSMVRVDLPPVGQGDAHSAASQVEGHDMPVVWRKRGVLIAATLKAHPPDVLLVEMFPFGRKTFAGEILPMIREATHQARGAPLVACSLRDILELQGPDQRRHDDRARGLADRYIDLVLAHTDPALVALADSFKPTRALSTPVVATGYAEPRRAPAPPIKRGSYVLVSAGGGIRGADLLRAALGARQRLTSPPPMRLIAGPFLPEAHWRALQADVAGQPGLSLLRQVPDMEAEMRAARASISLCGYNTALDILAAGVPALVVPYRSATENDQLERARRLAQRGCVMDFGATPLCADTLAPALEALLAFQPAAATIAVDGAERSAQALVRALAAHRSARRVMA